jgi:hypothetical protein
MDNVHRSTLMVTPSRGQLQFDQVGGSIMGHSLFLSFIMFSSVSINWRVALASDIGS